MDSLAKKALLFVCSPIGGSWRFFVVAEGVLVVEDWYLKNSSETLILEPLIVVIQTPHMRR